MRSQITKKEINILKKIDTIDAHKEAFKILDNPENYFNEYLKKVKSPVAIIFTYLSILSLLREIDTSEDICEMTCDYFIEKYSIDDWLNKLTNFYTYITFAIDYVINNHDNTILDSYNMGQIDSSIMKKSMKSFVIVKKRMLEDKDSIRDCISDLEAEKNRMDGFDDLGD